MHVKPVCGKSATIALSSFFSNVDKTLHTLKHRRLNIRYRNKTATLALGDYRHIVASMPLDPVLKSSARNAILEACFKAESIVSGAGIISIIVTALKFREIARKHAVENKGQVPTCDLSFISSSYAPTLDECFETISRYIRDDYCIEILKEACTIAGASGQIFLNDNESTATSVLLRSGFNFPIGILPEFQKAAKGTVTLYDSRVLLIDGIIESVGEIHHILDYYSKTKEQLVVFARGFSEEVIGTLVVNKLRGMLNVVPINVPYDLAGINMLNDIAAVCDTDIISSLKGELISGIDHEDIVTIEKLSITNTSTTFFTNPNKLSVRSHVGSLIKKRNKLAAGDVQEMIDQRIKCLSPRAIHVNIGPEHGDLRGLLKDRLDSGIRMFKDISRYGVVDVGNIKTSDEIIKKLISYFRQSGVSKVPARSLHVGISIGDQTAKLLATASVFLVDDRLHPESP